MRTRLLRRRLRFPFQLQRWTSTNSLCSREVLVSCPLDVSAQFIVSSRCDSETISLALWFFTTKVTVQRDSIVWRDIIGYSTRLEWRKLINSQSRRESSKSHRTRWLRLVWLVSGQRDCQSTCQESNQTVLKSDLTGSYQPLRSTLASQACFNLTSFHFCLDQNLERLGSSESQTLPRSILERLRRWHWARLSELTW